MSAAAWTVQMWSDRSAVSSSLDAACEQVGAELAFRAGLPEAASSPAAPALLAAALPAGERSLPPELVRELDANADLRSHGAPTHRAVYPGRSPKRASTLRRIGFGRMVIDFVPKPFTAKQIVSHVGNILDRRRRGEELCPLSGKRVRRVSSQQKQVIAQAIYARMRPQLARLPQFVQQLGDDDPAPFFARKLLTPPVVDELLDATRSARCSWSRWRAGARARRCSRATSATCRSRACSRC